MPLNSLFATFSHAFFYGAILSLLLTALVIASIWLMPEMWLEGLPSRLQAKSTLLSPKGKKQQTIFVLAVFTIVIALPGLAVMRLATYEFALDFASIFVTLFTVLMVWNGVDLLLIDWLLLEWWRPGFLFGHHPALAALLTGGNYRIHWIGFLKGTAGITLISLVVAGVLSWLV